MVVCISVKRSPALGMPEEAHAPGAESACLGACGQCLQTTVAECTTQRLSVLHRPCRSGMMMRPVSDLFMTGLP